MVCQLRAREKAVFALQNDESLMAAEDRIERIEKEIQRLKEEINSKSEELDIRQRCLKEFQMMAAEKQVRAGKMPGSRPGQDHTSMQNITRKNGHAFSQVLPPASCLS